MVALRAFLAVASALVAQGAHADDAVIGWYEGNDGTLQLIAPSGREGYRLLTPETRASDWLRPDNNDRYHWHDGIRRQDAQLTFVEENDRVTGYRWRRDGAEGFIPRTEQGPYTVAPITTNNGAITIAGNLYTPHGEGPHPAIVFIHGSGDNDRDNGWFIRFADYFVRKGVACLIPDKRGCGQSTGDWHDATFEGYARDTLALVNALRERADIGRVGVLGGSQGGAIAPIAGVLDPNLAFVINLSGSTVTLGEQVRHEITQDLLNDGANDAVIDAAMELFDLSHHYIRTGQGWDAYESRVKELRKSDLKQAAYGFITAKDNWYWTWWRGVIDVDPMDSWKRLPTPGLIVYGAEDAHDNVPVARSVSRLETELPGNHALTVRVFEDTGHGLRGEDGDIREDVLDFLSNWVVRQL